MCHLFSDSRNSTPLFQNSHILPSFCSKTWDDCTKYLASAAGGTGHLRMEESQANKVVSCDSLLPVCPSLFPYHMMPVMTT